MKSSGTYLVMNVYQLQPFIYCCFQKNIEQKCAAAKMASKC